MGIGPSSANRGFLPLILGKVTEIGGAIALYLLHQGNLPR